MSEYTKFQPTPSARRVTLQSIKDELEGGISTHTLREEGDLHRGSGRDTAYISTHTLREEGDFFCWCRPRHLYQFQPTPSARRVT